MAPVSLNTRITLAIVVVAAPLFVWAGRLDYQVTALERERMEIRQELRDIIRKLDDIRERLPLVRPRA